MAVNQTEVTGRPFPPGEPDVQRTSFSLDIMGRFFCNTLQEALTNPDFDVVVIGSGMYGAYTAAKIYRDSRARGGKPLRVLVLEAGPFLIHEHGQNIAELALYDAGDLQSTYAPDALSAKRFVWGFGWKSNVDFRRTAYCVGGKSLYWGGWCPRLRDADLKQWPEEVRNYLLGPPKFPSDFPNRNTAPGAGTVYDELEFAMGVKPADDYVFDPVIGPKEIPGAIGLNKALEERLLAALAKLRAGTGTPLQDPEPPPIAVQTQSFVSGVFSPDKFSSLTLLLAAVRSDKNAGASDAGAGIFLVPNTHVARLIAPTIRKDDTDLPGFAVTGLDVFSEGTRRPIINIRPTTTVVLALGCIESTRLALESFPTAPDRGGDELMGRNLMAHLRFDFPFGVNRNAFRTWVQNKLGKKLRDELQTAAFHLQADSPDGRFHLQVYGTGRPDDSGEGLLYRMIPDAEVARRLAAEQDPNELNFVFRACGELKGNRSAPVHAPGTNWIDLASAGDRDNQFDHARAFVHYEDQTNAGIWGRMKDACIALAREMGATNIPAIQQQGVGSTWHDAGALFMGVDPAGSVTDVNGHFHHMANAACVDQALFPTVGSANPVLTGLCLSRKVAETIVERFVSEPEMTSPDIAREESEGFEFLLKGPAAGRWKANNPRFVDPQHQPFITGGSIIELHGDSGLGVFVYDDPNLFGNFELRLQWKAFLTGTGDITANSGIFLRAPAAPSELNDANFYDQAIEIQIDETGYDFARHRFRSPLHRTGAIYKIAPARIRNSKILSTDGTEGFWNSYRIVARGRGIRVELNGDLVSEGDVSPALVRPGRIALQYHTGKVQFRFIRVKRL